MTQRHTQDRMSTQIDTQSDAVTECVRYILCREGCKVPLKRADIVKHLSTTCKTPGNQVQSVLNGAIEVLKEVYGYDLVPEKLKTGVVYMVVLAEGEEQTPLPSPVVEIQHQIVLNAVLTHIFMSGGPVVDEDMWKFLIKARLMEENDDSIRKIVMKKFVTQMYLTVTTTGTGELVKKSIEWGPRASREVSKMFILEKFAAAFDQPPNYYNERYIEAQKEMNNSTVNATQTVSESVMVD